MLDFHLDPEGETRYIYKMDDDMRQDTLVVQIKMFFVQIFRKYNLEVYLHPFLVVPYSTALSTLVRVRTEALGDLPSDDAGTDYTGTAQFRIPDLRLGSLRSYVHSDSFDYGNGDDRGQVSPPPSGQSSDLRRDRNTISVSASPLASVVNSRLGPRRPSCVTAGDSLSVLDCVVGNRHTFGGIVGFIKDSVSCHGIGQTYGGTLEDYFLRKFGPRGSPEFDRAMDNFVNSLAGYSLLCYLLQVKDRHNGNLLISREGHILHIDFGFLLGSSPAADVQFEKAPFKLTKDMTDVLGGVGSPCFQRYVSLLVAAFLCVRREATTLVTLVKLLEHSGMACFRRSSVSRLRRRLYLEATPERAARFMLRKIHFALHSKTTLPRGLVGVADDLALLVEGREVHAERVQVVGQLADQVVGHDLVQHRGQPEDALGERDFGGVRQVQGLRAQGRRVDARLVEDLADARVGVQQVDGGVAPGVEHVVEGELVVVGDGLPQLEVLDGPVAEELGDLRDVDVDLGVPLLQPRLDAGLQLDGRPRHGLVEQRHQLDRVAGPRLELVAGGVLDHAEPEVVEADLLVLQLGPTLIVITWVPIKQDLPAILAAANTFIKWSLCPMSLLDAIFDAREVGGVVAVAAVALDRHERHFADGGEEALGALRLDDQVLLLELPDDVRDPVVVEGLAAVFDSNVEHLVYLRELPLADFAEQPPRLHGHLLAALQHDHALPAPRLELRVGVSQRLGLLVELGEVADAGDVGQEVGVLLQHVLHEHAEVGAPVAEVVDAEHLVAVELEDPACGGLISRLLVTYKVTLR
ncbi:phosphatidylinositol 4-kinase [Babesia caballi]|uniref:Phosphatidylinositol 4-kinase n=1 Tax=Babesia caballi TaxID=5871 RepID=A0AAV4LWL4_BABCB|nr:phosphatidylinositol 4-kinase [Babesia caballi]